MFAQLLMQFEIPIESSPPSHVSRHCALRASSDARLSRSQPHSWNECRYSLFWLIWISVLANAIPKVLPICCAVSAIDFGCGAGGGFVGGLVGGFGGGSGQMPLGQFFTASSSLIAPSSLVDAAHPAMTAAKPTNA